MILRNKTFCMPGLSVVVIRRDSTEGWVESVRIIHFVWQFG